VVIYLDDITVFSKTDIEHTLPFEKGFPEVSKVRPFPQPQEIVVRYARGEAIRPHSISRGSEN
jgi:hypothetical protein